MHIHRVRLLLCTSIRVSNTEITVRVHVNVLKMQMIDKEEHQEERGSNLVLVLTSVTLACRSRIICRVMVG